ncbi:hypothetical protein [uncultured Pontibacter sp.]|nr:hypothetical protein [uncultured Pontibacter sp.]
MNSSQAASTTGWLGFSSSEGLGWVYTFVETGRDLSKERQQL